MDYKEFNVDLQMKENHIEIVRGIEQYDGGNILNIRLMEGTKPFNFSEHMYAEAFIKKPDGTSISEVAGQRMQILDPEQGRLSFLLNGQCTLVPGMHYLTIRIYDDTTVVSSARLNYYVKEANAPDVTEEELQSASEWESLIQIIARWSYFETAEALRRLAEQDRVDAENARAAETAGIVAQALEAMRTAQSYAELAETWANASQTIAQGGVLPVVTWTDLWNTIATLDGNGRDVDGTHHAQKIQIRRGEEDDIMSPNPLLSPGELYYATDTGNFYVGIMNGSTPANLLINKKQWAFDSNAPADTSILWIDTAHDNCIKFHDGNGWQVTNGARFT